MTQFHSHRFALANNRNAKFLAVFWAILGTIGMLSVWP